jgi:hypothetical protein
MPSYQTPAPFAEFKFAVVESITNDLKYIPDT